MKLAIILSEMSFHSNFLHNNQKMMFYLINCDTSGINNVTLIENNNNTIPWIKIRKIHPISREREEPCHRPKRKTYSNRYLRCWNFYFSPDSSKGLQDPLIKR